MPCKWREFCIAKSALVLRCPLDPLPISKTQAVMNLLGRISEEHKRGWANSCNAHFDWRIGKRLYLKQEIVEWSGLILENS
jgi:hypothetical protein